LQIHM